MADIDISDHDKMAAQPDETIRLNPEGVGATWEPERKQETSFRGMSIKEKVLRETN